MHKQTPDIILVHDALQGVRHWIYLITALRTGTRLRQVVTIDPNDHGTCRWIPSDGTTLARNVSVIVEGVKTNDLGNVVLANYSLGGFTVTPALNQFAGRLLEVDHLETVCPSKEPSVEDLLVNLSPGQEFDVDVQAMFRIDFNKCDTEWLVEGLCEEPQRPSATPVAMQSPRPDVKVQKIVHKRNEDPPINLRVICGKKVVPPLTPSKRAIARSLPICLR